MVIIMTVFFMSCEKDITIDLPDSEEKIVVEGWIEQDNYASVILTKNSPYFSVVDSIALSKLIITDAKVTVSDGQNSEELKLTINPNYFPPLVYTGSTLKGEIGKTYYLSIEVEGKTLTAFTTIPEPIIYDSIWFEIDQPKGDSLGLVWAQYSDPPETKNFYRIFTKRINKDNKFIPIFFSIYDDVYFNGKTLTFNMYRGFETMTDETQFEEDNYDEIGYFKLGDTIIVRSCSIDKAHYDFWRTIENEIYSGGNPFSTNIPVVTNIKGDGIGVWGGYGATYDTVIAK